jgi:DNA primase
MSEVEQVLIERGLEYRESGQDFLIKCLNPEHEDRNPSMRVDKVLGIFNCFSCGHKGSIFRHYNIDISESSLKRESLKRAIAKLRSDNFGMQMPEGYMPYIGNWRGISPKTYSKFNAFEHTDEQFKNRINFPITDSGGKIVCFQGRDYSMAQKAKYRFWPPNVSPPLFPQANTLQGRIILVEGLFDMLNLHDKGLDNAVCCLGVNKFNHENLDLLKVSGVMGIDVLFDGDKAGKEAAEKVKEICKGFPFRVVNLKSGDPGELSKNQVKNLRKRLYGS